MTLSEYKNYTNQLLFKVYHYSGLKLKDFLNDHYSYRKMLSNSVHISASMATKVQVHFGLYCTTLKAIGTEKHLKYLHRAYQM